MPTIDQAEGIASALGDVTQADRERLQSSIGALEEVFAVAIYRGQPACETYAAVIDQAIHALEALARERLQPIEPPVERSAHE